MNYQSSFWDDQDNGVDILLKHIASGLATCKSLSSFYKEVAKLDKEYARRMSSIISNLQVEQEYGNLGHALKVAKSTHMSVLKNTSSRAHNIEHSLYEEIGRWTSEIGAEYVTLDSKIRSLRKDKVERRHGMLEIRDKLTKAEAELRERRLNAHMVGLQEGNRNTSEMVKWQARVNELTTRYEISQQESLAAREHWMHEWTQLSLQLQKLEEKRIQFLTDKVYEYTDLVLDGSALEQALLEKLRTALSSFTPADDIARFSKQFGTGSRKTKQRAQYSESVRQFSDQLHKRGSRQEESLNFNHSNGSASVGLGIGYDRQPERPAPGSLAQKPIPPLNANSNVGLRKSPTRKHINMDLNESEPHSRLDPGVPRGRSGVPLDTEPDFIDTHEFVARRDKQRVPRHEFSSEPQFAPEPFVSNEKSPERREPPSQVEATSPARRPDLTLNTTVEASKSRSDLTTAHNIAERRINMGHPNRPMFTELDEMSSSGEARSRSPAEASHATSITSFTSSIDDSERISKSWNSKDRRRSRQASNMFQQSTQSDRSFIVDTPTYNKRKSMATDETNPLNAALEAMKLNKQPQESHPKEMVEFRRHSVQHQTETTTAVMDGGKTIRLPLYTSDGKKVQHYAKAMYTLSSSPETLEFEEGDYLLLFDTLSDQWYEGERMATGAQGLVPCNYIAIL